MDVYINLNFESKKAIYIQLKHQIIAGIAKEEIKPGERLPSVRSLAADIGINLHTVNKAYQQLKHEGYILIHRQRGVVVNPDGVPRGDETYKEELIDALQPFIAEAICRGLRKDEFLNLCTNIFNEFNEKKGGH